MVEKSFQFTHHAQSISIDWLKANNLSLSKPEFAAMLIEKVDPATFAILLRDQGDPANFTYFKTGFSPEALSNGIARRQPISAEAFNAICQLTGLNPNDAKAVLRTAKLLQKLYPQMIVQSVLAVDRLEERACDNTEPFVDEVKSLLATDFYSNPRFQIDAEAIHLEPSFQDEKLTSSSGISQFTVEALLGDLSVTLGYVFVHTTTGMVEIILHQIPEVFHGFPIRIGHRRVGLIEIKKDHLLAVTLKHLEKAIGQKPTSVSMVLFGEDHFMFHQQLWKLKSFNLSEEAKIRRAVESCGVGQSLKDFFGSELEYNIQVAGRQLDGSPQFIYISGAHAKAMANAVAA
jgi:hypothetical protein